MPNPGISIGVAVVAGSGSSTGLKSELCLAPRARLLCCCSTEQREAICKFVSGKCVFVSVGSNVIRCVCSLLYT